MTLAESKRALSSNPQKPHERSCLKNLKWRVVEKNTQSYLASACTLPVYMCVYNTHTHTQTHPKEFLYKCYESQYFFFSA